MKRKKEKKEEVWIISKKWLKRLLGELGAIDLGYVGWQFT